MLQPEGLLSEAERRSDVRLGEPELRQALLRVIERVLIPAVILERIVVALKPEPIRILAIGKGWRERFGEEIEPFAENLLGLSGREGRLRPLGAVFAGSLDPLSPALLHAGALGWPLLIHSPGARSLTAALGGMLHAKQHYQPFAGGKELRAAIQWFRDDPSGAVRLAERTREYLCEQHSWQQRLHSLEKLVRAEPHGPRP